LLKLSKKEKNMNKPSTADVEEAFRRRDYGQAWYKCVEGLGLSESTLRRYYSDTDKINSGMAVPREEEERIMDVIRKRSWNSDAMREAAVLKLANEYLDSVGKDRLRGGSWLRRFRMRFKKQLTRRKAKAKASRENTIVDAHEVNELFDILENVVETFGVKAENIFNMDETSEDLALLRDVHVLVPAGAEGVTTEAGDTRSHITTLLTSCADGWKMRPSILVQGSMVDIDILEKAESEHGNMAPRICKQPGSGYMTRKTLKKWLLGAFLYDLPPRLVRTGGSDDEWILLLVDAHISRDQPLEGVYKTLLQKKVLVVRIGGGLTGKMQPNDEKINYVFKNSLNRLKSEFWAQKVGKRMPMDDYLVLTASAWKEVSSGVVRRAWQKCGVSLPLDRSKVLATLPLSGIPIASTSTVVTRSVRRTNAEVLAPVAVSTRVRQIRPGMSVHELIANFSANELAEYIVRNEIFAIKVEKEKLNERVKKRKMVNVSEFMTGKELHAEKGRIEEENTQKKRRKDENEKELKVEKKNEMVSSFFSQISNWWK
jgi:hypothetical protein